MGESGAGAGEPTDFALWVGELTPMEALRVGMVESRSTWLTAEDPEGVLFRRIFGDDKAGEG